VIISWVTLEVNMVSILFSALSFASFFISVMSRSYNMQQALLLKKSFWQVSSIILITSGSTA
jgi:hypothetical protein